MSHKKVALFGAAATIALFGASQVAMAADAAVKLGYTNVKHFAPGIAGWKKSGAPTEKGS